MVDLIDAALIGGVKTADAFNFIAKEIKTQPNFASCREQVHNAAANGELASVGNSVDTEIAIGLQQ